MTLREAAGLLGINQIEAMNLFLDSGIKGNLDASDVLASLERFVPRTQDEAISGDRCFAIARMTTGDACPTDGNHSNNEMWR